MEEHRHTGHDLIFVTQRYALVHHHLRALVGRHEHLIPRAKTISVVFQNAEVFDPQDRGRVSSLSESIWTHPKHLYESYVSSSLHSKAQTSYQVPLKVKLLAGGLVVGGVLVGWLFVKGVSGLAGGAGADPPDTVRVPVSSQLVSAAEAAEARPLPSWTTEGLDGIGGCVATRVHCRCYDRAGRPIDFDRAQCMAELHAPLVRNLNFGSGGRGGERRASGPPPTGGMNLPLGL